MAPYKRFQPPPLDSKTWNAITGDKDNSLMGQGALVGTDSNGVANQGMGRTSI